MKLQEWQKGYESKLSSTERILLHQLWLEDIHNQIKTEIKLENKTEETESEPIGFIEI